MKIMVVDDERVSRLKMQHILSDFEEIVAIENGEKAVSIFKEAFENKECFDLITMDIEMPGMDGTETLLEIREFESKNSVSKGDQVKILMVTTHSHKDYVITSMQAGCNAYVVKPFTKKTVYSKLFELNIPIPI